ncbi:NACHT and TPR domain protein [Drechmeria coniospora]|uniref:NACHT and TPR domain protein n=1 Tax=Drechmeria coniospora TaxID=98403 RepID=A0A151GYH2_DRECN|nr:NACHT and TPR domain protein [Drechmeria coniospora]KYK62083.1 NACHT and TPR domain protein [Drechmeria coniospora]
MAVPLDVERQFGAIVADAAKAYRVKSGNKMKDFLSPPMRSIDDLKRELRVQNDHFSAFRARRRALFDTLGAAFAPVEVAGDVLVGVASAVFAPTQGIYAAVLHLTKAAQNVSATYDSIVELFVQLADFTSRLDVYVKHRLSPALRDKLIAILAALFQVLVLSANEARQGRFKAYFKRLMGLENPVQPALESLKSLTSGEERQVAADTYGGVSRIDAKADRIEVAVTQVNQTVQNIRSEQSERAASGDKLRKVLAPSPFPEDFYNAFRKSIVPGTCEWILRDEGLNAWVRGEKPYLWISGNAGTGKSYLTARIIRWGKETFDQRTSVGYFFFRANNPETRSVLQALRDVAYQLSEGDAFYASELMQKLHGEDEIRTVPSAFRQLFCTPPPDGPVDRTRYVFFDGIDEADEDEIKQLLSMLAPDDNLRPGSRPRFQFALVGRSYMSDKLTASLDPPVPGGTLTTVQVTSDRIAMDVSAFIHDSVLHSRVLGRTNVDFKRRVMEALERKADGLFIVAKFMMDDVNRKRHQSSILESLEAYPKEIDGVLQRTLDSLAKSISREEALTLEQLEAVLVMEFGDSPLFLEESMRRQYACFFELERQDGLTTDDLVKDFDRAQRNLKRDVGPARTAHGRSLSVGDVPVPRQHLSPAVRVSTSRHSSPTVSPPRPLSPLHAELLDSASDVEFRSNESTTHVTFFHTSVHEFFRHGRSAQAAAVESTVGFDINKARIHILKSCLKIFTQPAWFAGLDLGRGKQAIKQYAAWYWQEHVAAIDPAGVSDDDKRALGPQLYLMLTDESTMFDWSITYEKNDEGLDIFSDGNMHGLRRWLNDPAVIDGLDDGAKTFARRSFEKPVTVCEPMGRFYAKAWLAADCAHYVPTRFCFKIVHNVAFVSSGHEWSQANLHWPDVSIEERVATATAWAAQPETAHWHRRVGSTYLTMEMHAEALKHYETALEMDGSSVETSGRIAFCLYRDERYGAALDQALECAAMEDRDMRQGRWRGGALGQSRWRLYKDFLLIAQCAYRTGKLEVAHEHFGKAIGSAEGAGLNEDEFLEAERGYFEVLSLENLYGAVMDLAEQMAAPSTRSRYGQSRFVNLLVTSYRTRLVMDWIPKAASKTGKTDFLQQRLSLAIEIADVHLRETLVVLHLRLALGTTFAYARDIDRAIAVFEQISLDEYRPRGSIPTRQAYAMSFQRLAALYKQKVLDAGWTSAEARAWIGRLEVVQQKQDEHHNFNMPPYMLGSDVNAASIYLACFYRHLGRESEAEALLRALIRDSLDLLSDGEPENDVFALDNLFRIFTAAGETTNAQALARSMRKVNPEASFSTIGESPAEHLGEPKLPDIQCYNRSCFQCFKNMAAWEEFVVCRYCVECFCRRCLDKVIKAADDEVGEGNDKVGEGSDKVGEGSDKVGEGSDKVVCRRDHAWFTVPPLNRLLHTGEILLEDGRVQSFAAWKDKVRERWSVGDRMACKVVVC